MLKYKDKNNIIKFEYNYIANIIHYLFFEHLQSRDVDKINFEQKLKFLPKLVLLLKSYCIKGDYKVNASVFFFFCMLKTKYIQNKIDSKLMY